MVAITDNQPKKFQLGLWGLPKSGKTIFLTMLYSAFEKLKDWQIDGDEESRKFIAEALEEITVDLILPQKTSNTIRKIDVYNYILKRKDSGDEFNLQFIDAAGEYYQDISPSNDNYNQTMIKEKDKELGDIVDYLLKCDGVIFLIDPFTDNNYEHILRNLFLALRSRQKSQSGLTILEQYWAFCVNKVDDETVWKQGKTSKELAQEYMGKSFDEILSNYIYYDEDENNKNDPTKHRCRFYSIASIGRYKDEEKDQWLSVFLDQKVDKTATVKEKQDNPSIQESKIFQPTSMYLALNAAEDSTNISISDNSEKIQQIQQLKQGVPKKPFNIVPSVLWLIESILAHPSSKS